MNPPQPTWVSLVFDALRAADDFMSMAQLCAGTGGTAHQVQSSLGHLRNHRAVDSVVSEGALWWFATPETDTRVKQMEQRAPEEPGSRRKSVRRSRAA